MDPHKITNFEAAHPGESFPAHRSLSEPECERLRAALAQTLGATDIRDGLALVRRLHECASTRLGTGPEDGPLDVRSLVESAGFGCASTVLLNWSRFDDIDEMALSDLSDRFDDIWYPSSDDIEVLDASLTWALAVDHGGYVTLLDLRRSMG